MNVLGGVLDSLQIVDWNATPFDLILVQKCGQYDHLHSDLKEKQKNLSHKSYKTLGTLDGSLATALKAQFFIVPPTESHKDLPCPAPK